LPKAAGLELDPPQPVNGAYEGADLRYSNDEALGMKLYTGPALSQPAMDGLPDAETCHRALLSRPLYSADPEPGQVFCVGTSENPAQGTGHAARPLTFGIEDGCEAGVRTGFHATIEDADHAPNRTATCGELMDGYHPSKLISAANSSVDNTCEARATNCSCPSWSRSDRRSVTSESHSGIRI
jgi:hypothetical protein